MRWMKHLTRSHLDEKMSVLLNDCGLEGFGFFWLLCEVIAESIEKDSLNCSLTHPLPQWSRLLYSHHNKVSKYLCKLHSVGLCRLSNDGVNITVAIPNLLKYRDEYTSRIGTNSRQTPDSVPPNNRQSPDKLPTKKNTDRDREAEREREGEAVKVTVPTAAPTPASTQEAEPTQSKNLPESKIQTNAKNGHNGPTVNGQTEQPTITALAVKFRTTCERYGMRCSNEEWIAFFRWDWDKGGSERQCAAVKGIEDRLEAGDASLVDTTPRNYYNLAKWERNIRAPAKTGEKPNLVWEVIQKKKAAAKARAEEERRSRNGSN